MMIFTPPMLDGRRAHVTFHDLVGGAISSPLIQKVQRE